MKVPQNSPTAAIKWFLKVSLLILKANALFPAVQVEYKHCQHRLGPSAKCFFQGR